MEKIAQPTSLSIGGATYDLFVQVDHDLVKNNAFTLPLGNKIKVKGVQETCGGGACNTAVGLSRLGCKASFSGVIGDDQWGQKLLENFQKEHVSTEALTIVEKEVSSFSMILSASDGERVILYESGANAHLSDPTFNHDHAKKMQWIYLNHIHDDSCEIENDLVDIFSGEASPGLTWNPGGCHLDKGYAEKGNAELLKHTDLLLLNEEEALLFTKASSLEDALILLWKSGVKNVCISRGKKGSIATDGTNVYECPILTILPCIDTTGAGDAFGTGMTWALLRGKTLQDAMKTGTINAASVVSKLGAQAGLLTDIEIQEALNTHPIDVAVRSL